MDFEDGLFVGAIALISVGVGCYSWPAGMIALGVLLAIPPLVSLLRMLGGRKKDGDK